MNAQRNISITCINYVCELLASCHTVLLICTVLWSRNFNKTVFNMSSFLYITNDFNKGGHSVTFSKNNCLPCNDQTCEY